MRQLRVGGGDAGAQDLLGEAAAQAPVEKAAGCRPLQDLGDAVLVLHAARRVVQVGKADGHGVVHGRKHVVARGQLAFGRALGGIVARLLDLVGRMRKWAQGRKTRKTRKTRITRSAFLCK